MSRRKVILGVLGVAVAAVLAIVAYYWVQGKRYVSTDDARVALWAVKGACAALSIGITPRDDDAGDPRRPEVQP